MRSKQNVQLSVNIGICFTVFVICVTSGFSREPLCLHTSGCTGNVSFMFVLLFVFFVPAPFKILKKKLSSLTYCSWRNNISTFNYFHTKDDNRTRVTLRFVLLLYKKSVKTVTSKMCYITI